MDGSGAIGRAPDNITTMTSHKEETEEHGIFSVEFTCRNIPRPRSFVVEWSHPLMRLRPDLDPAQLIESDAIPRRLAAEGLDRELCGSGGCGDLRRRHGLAVRTREEADHRRWITAAQVIEMAHTLSRGYFILKYCQPAMQEMRGFESATVPQRWKAWQVSLTSLVN